MLSQIPLTIVLELFGFEAFCLFGDQGMIFKVVDLHGILYISERLCGYLFCLNGALVKNFIDSGNVLFPFLTACTDRCQFLLKNVVQEFLYLDIA